VLLLGAAATGEYDLSPLWWKEAAFVGAARHSTDPGLDGAPTAHSIARALEILADGYLPSDAVITHEFALEAHRDAITTARDRRAGAIKVVFRPALGQGGPIHHGRRHAHRPRARHDHDGRAHARSRAAARVQPLVRARPRVLGRDGRAVGVLLRALRRDEGPQDPAHPGSEHGRGPGHHWVVHRLLLVPRGPRRRALRLVVPPDAVAGRAGPHER